jgi:hypothetical protein
MPTDAESQHLHLPARRLNSFHAIRRFGVRRFVFARVAVNNTPQSADQSAGLRHIREAVMTFNASIALEG